MRIFALGDPHLSFGRPMPMDIFGELWRDHPRAIAAAWDERVGPEDVVLLPGDISWARSAAEVAPDLAFLAARPGRLKVLLRGNHDSWWSSATKVRRLLPPGMAAIHNDALRLPEGIVLCGGRGWNPPEAPWSDPEKDPPIFHRELARLELSLADARRLRRPGDQLLALLHYPPLGPGQADSAVLERLRAADVPLAVYGHLHADDHAWAAIGTFGGVELRFVAADYLRFAPVPVWDSEAGIVPVSRG
ncbi:MAG: metallophosphoesterase [Acidobacteria bacterium]|nr:metallophosphoesterase [Acidobacteriota bacterium]